MIIRTRIAAAVAACLATGAVMAAGHFTGFPSCLLDEDMVVQASMGAITDRTREQLCGSDVGIARARARLIEALGAMTEGLFSPAEAEIVRPADMIFEPTVCFSTCGKWTQHCIIRPAGCRLIQRRSAQYDKWLLIRRTTLRWYDNPNL